MSYPHVVYARMYEHIEPMDRGERYEDRLSPVLEEKTLGKVTGGGSQMNQEGGIDFADLEIEVANLDAALDVVVAELEKAGAPKGSEILSGDKTLRTFGATECLAIYLDGVGLPDEVYADLDFEQVVKDIGDAAGPDSYHGSAQGPERTGIFFVEPDVDDTWARVEPVLKKMPIGQNACVVLRSGKKGTNPREIMMPRH